MKHARNDYDGIQDASAAIELAHEILNLDLLTPKGQYVKRLARNFLGLLPEDIDYTAITTNGTTRLIPRDESVFLIRAQDAVSGDAVRAWADLAEKSGAQSDILQLARDHADKMDSWPKKKTPDVKDVK